MADRKRSIPPKAGRQEVRRSLTPRSQKILNATPMGRFGEPEELIGTLLWLCDAKASGFVNGIVVPIDGGFSAYSGV